MTGPVFCRSRCFLKIFSSHCYRRPPGLPHGRAD
uniref:Uncharacterized protein n=1 Tax=Anguilla anguilla TaxID=7936 RepID=A0A0E9T0E6_ANGAN